jgi:hypothetical protein
MDNEIKAKTGFHSNMKCIMTSDTKKQRRKFRDIDYMYILSDVHDINQQAIYLYTRVIFYTIRRRH